MFDAFLFSLTTAQTTASLALAKHLKGQFPSTPIVFGGTSCAGEMGVTLMEVAPEIDILVHSEAENCLGPLVSALNGLIPFSAVPGVSYRDRGTIVSTAPAPLFETDRGAMPLNFSSYFDRLSRHPALRDVRPWIPFETSRGCWYGEKSHCTFCGLNEIIKYREQPASGLIDTLETYEREYGCTQFYAVDLIMPQGFEKTVFPEIARRGHDWTIFFEIKSNMKHEDVVSMRRGGVKSIQPGIESLDDDVLRMMRKGVTAAQNIQMLRWARELGMKVDWNILVGFPGESPEHYLNQIDLLPSLFHLAPPTGIGRFELHRFSPYFDRPEEHGVRILGADPRYRAVFPLEPEVLDRLVYRFAFEHALPPDERLGALTDKLQDLGEDWWSAKRAGVRFDYCPRDDGSADLIDTRMGRAAETPLTPSEAALIEFLSEKRIRRSASQDFAKAHPEQAEWFGGRAGVEARMEAWLEERYLLKISGYIQSLALRRDEAAFGA